MTRAVNQTDHQSNVMAQSMRLNRARAKLREANHSETLVQDCAAELGFWDFGRFAAKYQRLFGELPSQTLRKGRPAK